MTVPRCDVYTSLEIESKPIPNRPPPLPTLATHLNDQEGIEKGNLLFY